MKGLRQLSVLAGALLMVLGLAAGVVLLAQADDLGSPTGESTVEPGATSSDGFVVVDAASLTPEARDTLALIARGGPYPYDQDDSVFFNREGILPERSTGYYREYTVDTPGSLDRGARRIVAGASGERYYTDDHYESFSLVRE